MERVKRRWWTRGVSLLAALVVLSAVISGLFQLAVLTLPSYRADLAAWVTEVANRPVQIGGVNLGWRGFSPRLDLDDITLYSEDGNESLTLDRLSLGFSLGRLLTGNLFPYRLEVSGLTLRVEHDAEGHWQVAGFAADDGRRLTPEQRQRIAHDLARFRRLTLRKSMLVLSGPRFGAQPQQVRVGRIDLEQRRGGVDVDARLFLPVTHGERVDIVAELDGTLADPETWRGHFDAELQQLRPQGWLAAYLQPRVQIAANDLNLRLDGQIEQGRLRATKFDAESADLIVARNGASSGARAARLRGELRRDANAWTVDLAELRLDAERLAQGTLRWRPLTEGGHSVDVDAAELRLTRLVPWLAVWREAPEAFAQAERLSGVLRNVVLRLRAQPGQTPRYSLTAQLHDVALADQGRFGFAHLGGTLSATENGGSLRIGDAPLQVQLPATFATPLTFDELGAQLIYQRVADGWRVSSPELRWRVAGVQGSARLLVLRPRDPERSTWIELASRFSAADVTALKPYVPMRWPESLQKWLQRAVQAGRISRGQLDIRGPLRDFPYHARATGAWSLDLDIRNGRLAFAPDWPALERVAAQLRFRGNGLELRAQSGMIAGNAIEAGTARIADFAEGRLDIDAQGGGDIARFYELLRASPLKKRFAGLLDHTRAAGPARIELGLTVPLRDAAATQAHGRIGLDDVQMFYQGLEPPISGIRGDLRFDMQTVAGENLQARFAELPLAIRVEPRPNTHGVVVADFALTPNADGIGASQFIPGFLRGSLHGESQWRAELPIRDRDVALSLSSELVGTALDLPEPLGKPAAEARRLALRIGGDSAAPLRVGLNYARLLQADLAFAAVAEPAKGVQLSGLRARLGGEAPPKAVPGELLVDGHAATMDVSAWIALLSRESGRGNGPQIQRIDLEIDHLRWRDQLSAATRLRYQPVANGWRVSLAGEGAKGELEWQGPSPGRLQARLDHLVLTPHPSVTEAPSEPVTAAEGPPLDPARLPALDLRCEVLRGADADFGHLALRTTPVAGGQRLEHFELGGGIAELSASGQWRRLEGRSTAELRYQFKSRDVERVLKALAYAPNLSAQDSASGGELQWAPSPAGLFWHAASGRIDLAAERGQLRPVKPGASRVLGLINLLALPRRLTLNFSDVVDEGLAFDTIRGHFELGGGAALTDDLRIEGPSLRMDVRGRLGLAARDYDQRVTVYPGVSSGVTLGAALLGGPAVGALVLLAQEVLDKPLDQVSQLTYHVSGSWDNPKVERVEAREAGARKR